MAHNKSATKPPVCLLAVGAAISRFKRKKMSRAARRMLHLTFALCLIIIVTVQSVILNFLLIVYSDNDHLLPHMLWFIADLICVCFFLVALMESYRYLAKIHYNLYLNLMNNLTVPVPIGVQSDYWLYRVGVLPLSYVSWLVYSTVLLAKLVTFVTLGLVFKMPNDLKGLQLLMGATSMAAFVFFFLVEGHTWAERGSHRYIFVTLICSLTALDLVDTVTLLGTLYDFILKQARTKMVETRGLEVFIMVIAACSVWLPALPLYMLSMSDRSAKVFELPISTFNDLLHLLLMDVPYVGARAIMWKVGDPSVAPLLIKNIFFIFMQLFHIVPDMRELVRQWKWACQKKRKQRMERELQALEEEERQKRKKEKKEEKYKTYMGEKTFVSPGGASGAGPRGRSVSTERERPGGRDQVRPGSLTRSASQPIPKAPIPLLPPLPSASPRSDLAPRSAPAIRWVIAPFHDFRVAGRASEILPAVRSSHTQTPLGGIGSILKQT